MAPLLSHPTNRSTHSLPLQGTRWNKTALKPININFLAVDPSVSSRSGCLADREDLRNPRRCPDLSSSRLRYRRLGKDEKLAQEANLPFTVRVSAAQYIQYIYLKEMEN